VKLVKDQVEEFLNSAAEIAWLAIMGMTTSGCSASEPLVATEDFAKKIKNMRKMFELPESDAVNKLASGLVSKMAPCLTNPEGKPPIEVFNISKGPAKMN
jgi:hypothetical protein